MPMYSESPMTILTPSGEQDVNLFLCSEVRILTPKTMPRMIQLQLDKYFRADDADTLVESESITVSNAGVAAALTTNLNKPLGETVAMTAYGYLQSVDKIPDTAVWVDA